MKKHRNIPVFIPFEGCPHKCVFCSQEKITGVCEDISNARDINALNEAISTANGDCQIAFFGGSFTAIGKERMTALLSEANRYIKAGKAQSIRISTRPDCISDEILDILAFYGVTDIELGIQSVSQKVLAASGRGHTVSDCYKGAESVVKRGFFLTGQMMLGLPCSTPQDELQTANAIVQMSAVAARIYPTVVFAGTKLFDMTISGEYKPLTDEQAIISGGDCLEVFVKNGVEPLRIGLHASDELAKAPYGVNNPSIGELIKARVYYNIITESLSKTVCTEKTLEIGIKASEISKFTGHGGRLKNELINALNLKKLFIYTAETNEYQPIINIKD